MVARLWPLINFCGRKSGATVVLVKRERVERKYKEKEKKKRKKEHEEQKSSNEQTSEIENVIYGESTVRVMYTRANKAG